MLHPVDIDKGERSLAVRVPDIPGCTSGGEDFNDAIESLKEAIEAPIDLLLEDGEPIPDATSINNYQDDPDYAGIIWALVDVDISRLMGKSAKIIVTLLSTFGMLVIPPDRGPILCPTYHAHKSDTPIISPALAP